MKKLILILFSFIVLISLVNSDLGFSNPNLPKLEAPAPIIITFNNNTAFVNSSDCWVTNEGVKCNVPDIDYSDFGGSAFWDINADLGAKNITTTDTGIFGEIINNGLTANLGVYTDGNKKLTSTAPSSGILGHWTRTGTTLGTANMGDGVIIDRITIDSDVIDSASGLISFTNDNLFSGGSLTLSADTSQIKLGGGSDVSTRYNGSDWLFNSQLVGDGDFIFQGGDVRVENNLIATLKGTFGDLTVDLPTATVQLDVNEVSIFAGAVIFPEIDMVNSLGNSFGSMKDTLYIRGATGDPDLIFSDSGLTAIAQISYVTANDRLDFKSATGGYKFDENITTTEYITSRNVFIPQYVFSHNNATITLVTVSVWINVTFDQEDDDIKQGINHNFDDDTNTTYTINDDGIYEINFNYDVEDTSGTPTVIDVAGRLIYVNGTEIQGSTFEKEIVRQGVHTGLSHEFLAKFDVGDQVVFQFIATDVDVVISMHGVFGDHPDSATITIKKIANL